MVVITPLWMEATQLARLFGHDRITAEHVLAAWLKIGAWSQLPDRDLLKINVRKEIQQLWDMGFVERIQGQDVETTPQAEAWLDRINQTPGSEPLLREMIEALKYHLTPSDPPALAGPESESSSITQVPVVPEPVRAEVPVLTELEKSMLVIDNLVGLGEVKEHVHNMVNLIKFREKAERAGADVPVGLHLAFVGDPGTGKTTVAKLYARIYKELGLLTNGHTVEVTRGDLVGQYIGQTAPKVIAAVDRAMGGVLFIDEAHSLYPAGANDYGHEALSELVKLMEERRGQFAVILAGYTDNMAQLIDSDPGLKSRINKQVYFENYSAAEMVEIVELVCRDSGLQMRERAKAAVLKHMNENVTSGTEGNGRYARKLFEKICELLAQRVMNSNDKTSLEITLIEPEDVPRSLNFRAAQVVAGESTSEVPTLESALAELNALTGLNEVKTKVETLVNLLRANQAMEKAGKRPVPANLHLVFTGDPGTGKTTVAHIVAKIYRALGVLPSGHLVIANRESLVASYVGQTAPKVKAKIDESMGGILFVDEAYALTPKSENDFGAEAIATLIDAMESRRGQFAVIFAGYKDEMAAFVAANPGMRSRTEEVFFPNYSKDELVKIFSGIAKSSGVKLSDEFTAALRRFLEGVKTSGDAGNARFARTLFESAFANAVTRVAREAGAGQMDIKVFTNLVPEDLPAPPPAAPERRRVGFGGDL